MPIVTVQMFPRGKEQNRRLIEGITKVLEEIGVPPKAVHVVIQEVPMENWGIEGKPCDELFKGVDDVKKYFQ